MKLQMAIFKTEHGSETPVTIEPNPFFPDGKCWADGCDGYVRMTENAEVEFKELPRETVVAKQVEQIAEQEQKLRAAFSVALTELEDRRAKLLALTYSEAAA